MTSALFASFLEHYQWKLSLLTAVGFALAGAVLSMLRLSEAGRRGAERVQVHDHQRLKGD